MRNQDTIAETDTVEAEPVDVSTDKTISAEQPNPEQPDDTADDATSTNAEAAKWRRKLRDTEAELGSLSARLEAVQRQQVELMLGKSGVKSQAIFAVAELGDLLDDDGAIDGGKLSAAIVTATERFGIVKPLKGSVVPGVGNQPDALPSVDRWADAFAPKRH